MAHAPRSAVRRVFLKSFLTVTVLGMGVAGGIHGLTASAVEGGAKSVKVGVIMAMTGQQATYGTESVNGLKLALESIGDKDPKMNLIVEDTLGTPKGSAEAVNKLIKSDRVSLIIGEVASSNTIAASGPAQDNKVPLMTPASTNDTVTSGKDYVSRICFIDSFQGEVMANFAARSLKAKTAVILVDSDSDYSAGLKGSFTKAFTKAGGKVLADVSYSQKDTDFTAQLTKVRRQKPDVLFIPGYYTQVGSILRQAKELGIPAKILGTDGWDSPKLFEIAGKASAGHYVSSHFAADDTNPKVQEFVKKYRAKYNVAPGTMAALGYDAGLLAHDALKRAKSTEPAKIRDAINATKNFEGITGVITLDANRNAVKPATILETTETGWKFHSRVNP